MQLFRIENSSGSIVEVIRAQGHELAMRELFKRHPRLENDKRYTWHSTSLGNVSSTEQCRHD